MLWNSVRGGFLVGVVGLAAVGCSGGGGHYLPAADAGGVDSAQSDGAIDLSSPLGPRQAYGFHVLAGATTPIPTGQIAMLVDADGHGNFSIRWTAPDRDATNFQGTVSTDGAFTVTNRIGAPGSLSGDTFNVDCKPGIAGGLAGVDLYSSTDPIYMNIGYDSVKWPNIYFTEATTGKMMTTRGADAYYSGGTVAFTSP